MAHRMIVYDFASLEQRAYKTKIKTKTKCKRKIQMGEIYIGVKPRVS